MEKKTIDENWEEYLEDEEIITLMETYNLDRDTAEEVYVIMTDLGIDARKAIRVHQSSRV